MNNKKLEKLFFEYRNSHPNFVSQEDEHAIIFSKEDFHFNYKMKTLYLKKFGVIDIPNIENYVMKADWLALWTKANNKEEIKISIGIGNPYSDDYKDSLPNENGIIVATPHSLMFNHLKKEIAQD